MKENSAILNLNCLDIADSATIQYNFCRWTSVFPPLLSLFWLLYEQLGYDNIFYCLKKNDF